MPPPNDEKTVKSIEEILNSTLDPAAKLAKIMKALGIDTEKTTESLTKQVEILEKIHELDQDRISDEKLKLAIAEKELQNAREWLQAAQAIGEETKDFVKAMRDAEKAAEDQREKVEEIVDQMNQAASGGTKFARVLGLGSTYQETMIGQLHEMAKGFAAGGEAAEKWQKDFKKANVAGALLAGTFEKIVESTIQEAILMDQVAASFAAATQASQEFNEAMLEAGRGATSLGVGTQEAGEAAAALYNNFNAFSSLSEDLATNLTRDVAAMQQLGISGEDASQTLNLFNKSLGLGAEASHDLQKEVLESGTAIGVSMAKTSQQVKEAQIVFIQFGHVVGTKVFKELQFQAKKTGLEISDLLSITEGFRTFEGAAESAGRLNAVLGGNLFNAVEMLTMADDELIESLRNNITATMGSFESLGMMEKRMIANVVANGDLAKASKLLTQQTQVQIKERKTLIEAQKEAQTITKQLTLFVANFAIRNKELIDSIRGIITTMNEWMDEHPVATQVITGLVLLIGSLTAASLVLGPGLKLLAAALKVVGPAGATGSLGIKAMATAAVAGVKGLAILAGFALALGTAMMMAGKGFKMYGEGIRESTANSVEFAKALRGIDPEKERVFKSTVDHYARVVGVAKDAGPDLLTKATALANSLTVNIDKTSPINAGAAAMENRIEKAQQQTPVNITVQIAGKKVADVLWPDIQKKVRESVDRS